MERDTSPGAGGDSSSRFGSSYEKSGDRTRFNVDLRPGETTIVSWKKLTKDVPKPNQLIPSASLLPAAASAPDPSPALAFPPVPVEPNSSEMKDAAGSNRFNSVIEKIERLYMGKDSSEEDVSDLPSDNQYDTEDSFIDDAELDEYFEVDKSKTKHDGFFVNRGKLESMESSLPPNEQLKKRRKKEKEHSTEANGLRLSADDSGYIRYQGKSGSGHLKNISRKGNKQSEISFQQKEKNGKHDLIDLNVAAVKNPMKTSAVHKREVSSFKHKSTDLDKAIRELEKAVAISRPPAIDLQDADGTSQGVKRRLSREIKQRLAKVARIGVSHGKMSKELLNRLMSILGHLVNVRSLKRNLKLMISPSFPLNQEKEDKFQQIKREVVEMIKTKCQALVSKAAEVRPGVAQNVQESSFEEIGLTKVKYTMDPVLEDKICDLYGIYVEGIDEDLAPQVRKLYAELAELWPKGTMDIRGIKRAICHSKERRRSLRDRNKEHGSMKIKKLGAVKKEETRIESTSMQQQNTQEKAYSDLGNHVRSPNKSTPRAATSAILANPGSLTFGLPAPSSDARSFERPKHDKLKRPRPEIMAADGTMAKKKVKRKQESNLDEVHPLGKKTSVYSRPDKHKPHKQQTQDSSSVPSLKQLT